MYLQVLHLCAKFKSNRTITYGDIALRRFGGYKCHLAANAVVLVLGGYQISIATNLRGVSTLIYNLKEIRWILFELECSRRLGGRGGGDAKTIISPNTSFGDITRGPGTLCSTLTEVLYGQICPINDNLTNLGWIILLFLGCDQFPRHSRF